jgi:hypothetical protein
VVLEALRAGQHKNIYCGVLRVRKTRYYIKNYSRTYQSTDWPTSLQPVGTLVQLRVCHSTDWHFHRWLAFYYH